MTPDPKLLIMLTPGLKEYSPFCYFHTFVILKCLLLKISHNSSRFYNTSVISTPILGELLKNSRSFYKTIYQLLFSGLQANVVVFYNTSIIILRAFNISRSVL